MTDKERMTEAFKALRRLGYTTRQNFSCCGGCAMAQLAAEVEQGKNHDKFVTYNRQSNEAFNDYGKLTKSLWLRWDGDAKEIIGALEAAGFQVAEHGGGKEFSIQVYPFRAEDFRTARVLYQRLVGEGGVYTGLISNREDAIVIMAGALSRLGIKRG